MVKRPVISMVNATAIHGEREAVSGAETAIGICSIEASFLAFIFQVGSAAQFYVFGTIATSIALLLKGRGPQGQFIGALRVLTQQAWKKAIDKGFEGWQTGHYNADVTLNGRPDGTTIIVICSLISNCGRRVNAGDIYRMGPAYSAPPSRI